MASLRGMLKNNWTEGEQGGWGPKVLSECQKAEAGGLGGETRRGRCRPNERGRCLTCERVGTSTKTRGKKESGPQERRQPLIKGTTT